jgi:hypothetical protein
MTKKKVYKNNFINDGETVSVLPTICRTCYGFSNWNGDRSKVIYEDRDCVNCKNKRTIIC